MISIKKNMGRETTQIPAWCLNLGKDKYSKYHLPHIYIIYMCNNIYIYIIYHHPFRLIASRGAFQQSRLQFCPLRNFYAGVMLIIWCKSNNNSISVLFHMVLYIYMCVCICLTLYIYISKISSCSATSPGLGTSGRSLAVAGYPVVSSWR